jgi:L-amino acid N-acyltransferase YncA
MNIIFTEITENDIPFAASLYNYYIVNTTATFHTHPMNQREMHDLLFFSNQNFRSFLISCDKTPAGYVILAPHKPRQAYNQTGEISVYLEKDFLQKGIGSAAVQFIEQYARENKFHSLIATICGENTSSIKLFEKCGFFKCAHYKEVGFKHDKYLDVVSYQKLLHQ